ncbi:hypothetical protein SRABI76_03186 [Microbacterium oxydans]|uniref:Uncharacterized protein n=1 Tax=Microbacterium oxydans TaxID=82380 RepID=A0A0F0LQM7_9MICO|nr:hypothetical protein [Microbacterium oxydans]KJL33826.1 hypothetical protein RS83_00062 [Microbacterium oxydans]CAH0248686.1 hypothetical protein SRABI76_03186 [Microbacterium oxydans]
MDTLTATRTSDHGPIDTDWTIDDLIQWLSDDAGQHDEALRRPLARIEALLTGTTWSGTPSTVALIRSITDAVRRDPALRRIRIGELDRQESPRMPERIPQLT